jgi:hypothetical protein
MRQNRLDSSLEHAVQSQLGTKVFEGDDDALWVGVRQLSGEIPECFVRESTAVVPSGGRYSSNWPDTDVPENLSFLGTSRPTIETKATAENTVEDLTRHTASIHRQRRELVTTNEPVELVFVTDEISLPVEGGKIVCDALALRVDHGPSTPVLLELKTDRMLKRLVEQVEYYAALIDENKELFAATKPPSDGPSRSTPPPKSGSCGPLPVMTWTPARPSCGSEASAWWGTGRMEMGTGSGAAVHPCRLAVAVMHCPDPDGFSANTLRFAFRAGWRTTVTPASASESDYLAVFVETLVGML